MVRVGVLLHHWDHPRLLLQLVLFLNLVVWGPHKVVGLVLHLDFFSLLLIEVHECFAKALLFLLFHIPDLLNHFLSLIWLCSSPTLFGLNDLRLATRHKIRARSLGARSHAVVDVGSDSTSRLGRHASVLVFLRNLVSIWRLRIPRHSNREPRVTIQVLLELLHSSAIRSKSALQSAFFVDKRQLIIQILLLA